jgi:outer membrane immunogenic protein
MAKKIRSRRASLTLLDIVAGIGVAAIAAPALAADLPTKAPPPVVAPAYTWTGFYLGAHAGYRWADADFTSASYVFDPDGPGGISPITFPGRSEGYNPNGGIVGLHGGYNYQFSPSWLVGIEGDWTWGNGSDRQNSLLTVLSTDGNNFRLNTTSEVKLGWQATIRGRVGYVQGPWLLYATGGVAFAHAEWSDAATLTFAGGGLVATAASSASKTLTGFAVGGGTEYMFNRNWIGRLEYLYEDFGNFSVPFGFGQIGSVDISAQKVRAGISYKFGN